MTPIDFERECFTDIEGTANLAVPSFVPAGGALAAYLRSAGCTDQRHAATTANFDYNASERRMSVNGASLAAIIIGRLLAMKTRSAAR